jgi:hypothetical protein
MSAEPAHPAPGVPRALEPANLPNRPLMADQVSALIPKIIG